MTDHIAQKFLLLGIQEWGQTNEKRADVTAQYLRAAGFDVEPSGYPVFGGMFPQQAITGKDGSAAHLWLHDVLDNLKRGNLQNEVEQLAAAISARQESTP